MRLSREVTNPNWRQDEKLLWVKPSLLRPYKQRSKARSLELPWLQQAVASTSLCGAAPRPSKLPSLQFLEDHCQMLVMEPGLIPLLKAQLLVPWEDGKAPTMSTSLDLRGIFHRCIPGTYSPSLCLCIYCECCSLRFLNALCLWVRRPVSDLLLYWY